MGLVMSTLERYARMYETVLFVHGGAKGADNLVERYARRVGNFMTETHAVPSSQWKMIGRAAGILRNQQMVDMGAVAGIAFAQRCVKSDCRNKTVHVSHGTQDCMTRMEIAGIPVEVVTNDGELDNELTTPSLDRRRRDDLFGGTGFRTEFRNT